MAITNADRISKGLDLLRDGLRPICEQTWSGFYGDDWATQVHQKSNAKFGEAAPNDVAFLLSGLKSTWTDVWAHGYPNAVRSLVFEVSEARNKWAHQQATSSDDTARALDSMERLLEALGNTAERQAIRNLRREVQRLVIEEESRTERRKTAAMPTQGEPQAGLTPWRNVITPHSDVASGTFEQAEFAADLHEVYLGTAESEYQDPRAFFARTFLTTGLTELLVGAARRLSGTGGDPVIELQTNFGGGKTHSMIALYHLASGVAPGELAGVGEALAEQHLTVPPTVARAVLVGQKISVANPEEPEPGVRLHTIWGQLAYQLGGKSAYELIRLDDEAGANPGARLKTIFEQVGPAIVLIDEWVAYARQLRDDGTKPQAGGDFDTQFTFAQALTEAASSVKNVVLLISIPASDIEVGGERGKAALEKLKNVVTRKAKQWQPASPDESFEIVRRRLFDPITADNAKIRDGVIRAFCDMYRQAPNDFPSDTSDANYRRRMEASYPIHPELFDRLFGEWSALDKFQRTRGVLRLMATAISQLWLRNDQSLLIMPGTLPMDSGALVSEMRKYLEEGWDPVIKSDVDGQNALPLRLDAENKHFGKVSAARRAARTVYMASAARPDGSRGVDMKSIVLGCAQPGESPAQFGDAIKRLSSQATHLYVDGSQFWYSLQPNVIRVASDRAASNFSDHDADDEVRRRIVKQAKGGFAAMHVFAEGPGDVPDEPDGVRLVVLPSTVTHQPNDNGSTALALAARILAQRDGGPRVNRNLLVFLAASANRLVELRSASRSYLAWTSVVADREALNLNPHQYKQATIRVEETHKAVDSLIDEAFSLIITPSQLPGTSEVSWATTRTGSAPTLPERVIKNLGTEEKLISAYGGVRVRMDIDRYDLWSDRGDLAVSDLWQKYTRFLHLPRLASLATLNLAISDGVSNFNWQNETFAYAQAHDGAKWVGITVGNHVDAQPSGLLIRPAEAVEATKPAPLPPPAIPSSGEPPSPVERTPPPTPGDPAQQTRTDFYALFDLDPVRAIKQLADILDNVAAQLKTGATLSLEIRSSNPTGFDDNIRRTVTENAKSLQAHTAEFE
jgi:predicted AAA+ superfamily ATPase